MSSYALKSTFDENRMFIIQKIDIKKRLDPFFYSPLNRLKILEKTNLSKKKLSEIADLKRGKFSHRPRNDERFFGGEYPFIQTGEIVKASNNYGKIQFSQTLNELGLSVSKLFDKDVLLITIAANIGDTAILDYPACFPDSIVAISSKDENVSLKYLNVYFKFLKKYLENLAPSAAQKNLTLEQLAPTPVILPTIENQNKIVEIFDAFIFQKQTNEAEAEKLLASIDDYLLGELGITLPTPPENTLKNRMFIANSKDILGSRFDPHFNKTFYNEVFKSFSKSKFNVSKIKDVLENIKTGTTPNQKLEPYADENGIVFLRNTNLKKYNIDLSDTKFIKTELAKELTYSVKNEVIMCIAGTVGLSAVNNIDKPFSINQNVSALKFFDNQINPDFASYWFNTAIFLELTKRACSVATIFYLNNDNLKLLPIPVPPLDKQKEMADHITEIRNQAQALKDKTKDLLKKASEEIEEILLN